MEVAARSRARLAFLTHIKVHSKGRMFRRAEAEYLRHGLIDGLDAVAHGELVDNLLGRIVEVGFPGLVLLLASIRLFVCWLVVADRHKTVARGECSVLTPLVSGIFTPLFSDSHR